MSTKNQTRYSVFSKRAFSKNGTIKSLKNCRIREEARNFKRAQANGTLFGIFDKKRNMIIR